MVMISCMRFSILGWRKQEPLLDDKVENKHEACRDYLGPGVRQVDVFCCGPERQFADGETCEHDDREVDKFMPLLVIKAPMIKHKLDVQQVRDDQAHRVTCDV